MTLRIAPRGWVEFIFFSVLLAMIPFGDTSAQPHSTPILFISGFNQSIESMRPLAERVREKSGRTVLQYTLPLPQAGEACDRESVIARWRAAVLEAAAQAGGEGIDVVAHSLGATVVMQLADEGLLRVHRAVFLAPALQIRPQIAVLLASSRLLPASLRLPSLGPADFSLEKSVCVGSYQAMRRVASTAGDREGAPFSARVVLPQRDEFVSPVVLARYFPAGALHEIHVRPLRCPGWQHLFPHPEYAGAEGFESLAVEVLAGLK